MTVRFDTSPYRASHNKEPRGHGSWAFSATRNPDVCSDAVKWAPFSTYTEAKRWARAQFASVRNVYVYVMP